MHPLRSLLPYLRSHVPALLLAGLAVVGSAGATMALVPLARYAAEAFGALTLPKLNGIVVALVGLYAVKGAFGFAQAALSTRVALAVTASLREEAFGHLLTQSLRYHQRQRPAELSSRLVQDLGVLKDALASLLAELVPGLAVIAYSLGYALWLNWRLALCTFVGAPLVGLAIAQFGERLGRASGEIQARVGDVFVRAQESLAAIALIQSFGREAEERARFATANRSHQAATWRGALIQALQPPVVAVLQTAAIAGVLWVGGYEITQGRLAAPDLIAFAAAIGIGIDPTLAVGQAWSRLAAAGGAFARVLELLGADERLPEPAHPAPLGPVSGALRCEGLTFAYTPGRPVLAGLDLAVAAGEVVALVGPSGGGKSTLTTLLLRLHDPDAGRITLDGRDLRDIATADLRRAIAYVPQDPLLMAGTVAENLAYGRPDATRAELEAACRIAEAHDFVTAMSEGYDTLVGERGASLSGGQRQRLAIARALVADPRVLILDEATSALDNEAEEAVRTALHRLMAGRTTLIVAHRLSAVAHADRIAVIADGRVVELGTREALLAQGGAFRRLSEAGML